MDAQEITDWQVLEHVEPFGQAREDARFAMLASIVANAAGAKKLDGTGYSPKDFMIGDLLEKAIKEVEETVEITQEQRVAKIEAAFKMAVAANNAFWAKKDKLQTPGGFKQLN
jgi:hypothetical protein